MTMPPGGPVPPPQGPQQGPQQWPPQGQYPQQPPQQWPAPGQRSGGGRKALPWIVGGAVVVAAALVVTLVLVLGGDDDKSGGTETADLSTPVKAAESFVAAVRAGDPDAVLALTCFSSDVCVDRHGEGATPAQVDKVEERIRQGIGEMADQLADAKFEEPNEASSYLEGAMEVPYRTPEMGPDEFRAMIFVEVDGKWLYIGGSGGGTAGPGDSDGPGDGGPPDATPTESGPPSEEETESGPPPTTCETPTDSDSNFPSCQ